MKYYISIEYVAQNAQKINFPIPASFVWFASSSDATHKRKIQRYTLAGDVGVGNAVDQLIAFCDQLVVEAVIQADYRIEITK